LFQILDGGEGEDAAVWLDLWRRFPDGEVFAHPDYVNLYASRGARAMCAAFHSGGLLVLYPFLLRDLSLEAYWSPGMGRVFDVGTAYGYGGPYAWGGRDSPEAAMFWGAFHDWCARNRVVSEFVRFSLFPDRLLAFPGRIWKVSEHVVRGLQLDESGLWMDYAHKVRKNVNRARQSGVSIEIEGGDVEDSRLDEFLGIYRETMERRRATESYHFPRPMFEHLRKKLAGNAAYFFAVRGGEVISAELALVSDRSLYSFLGGTREDALQWRPNDLLKFEMIRWAKARGKTKFVLGGGYRPDDGIFRYKLAFAPAGRVAYLQGGRIHDPERYGLLVESRKKLAEEAGTEREPPATFFPRYRG